MSGRTWSRIVGPTQVAVGRGLLTTPVDADGGACRLGCRDRGGDAGDRGRARHRAHVGAEPQRRGPLGDAGASSGSTVTDRQQHGRRHAALAGAAGERGDDVLDGDARGRRPEPGSSGSWHRRGRAPACRQRRRGRRPRGQPGSIRRSRRRRCRGGRRAPRPPRRHPAPARNPAGRSASANSSARRIVASGTRSEGLRMSALPPTKACGIIHIGTIIGKLNGTMPATTPSGSILPRSARRGSPRRHRRWRCWRASSRIRDIYGFFKTSASASPRPAVLVRHQPRRDRATSGRAAGRAPGRGRGSASLARPAAPPAPQRPQRRRRRRPTCRRLPSTCPSADSPPRAPVTRPSRRARYRRSSCEPERRRRKVVGGRRETGQGHGAPFVIDAASEHSPDAETAAGDSPDGRGVRSPEYPGTCV